MLRYRINKVRSYYSRVGARIALTQAARTGYEKLVPPNLDLKIHALWYRFRGHIGIGNPFHIYFVDTDRICRVIQRSHLPRPLPRFGVMGGDWHKKAIPLSDTPTHQMMVEHFNEGLNWEETSYYTKICDKIENDGYYGRLDSEAQTVQELHSYLDYLDDLYQAIKNNGYKRQTELTKEDDYLRRDLNPYLNEIQVCIGPRGEIFHKTGGHRLTIAKILEVDEIPVRTRVRHREWQRIRNSISKVEDIEDIDKECKLYLDHPEISDLIDRNRITQ